MDEQQIKEKVLITLPKSTLTLVDEIWQKKDFKSRSDYFDKAVRYYALRLQKAQLKRQLKESYKARSESELALSAEWEQASLQDFSDNTFDQEST